MVVPREEALHESVAAANLVVTFFSNVGLEAAVMERDVLVIALYGHFPLDLSRGGLAIAARTPSDIDHQVTRYLTDEQYRRHTTAARHAFIQGNPQLSDGKAACRVVDLMESLVRE